MWLHFAVVDNSMKTEGSRPRFWRNSLSRSATRRLLRLLAFRLPVHSVVWHSSHSGLVIYSTVKGRNKFKSVAMRATRNVISQSMLRQVVTWYPLKVTNGQPFGECVNRIQWDIINNSKWHRSRSWESQRTSVTLKPPGQPRIVSVIETTSSC